MAFSDIAFKALQDVLGKENATIDPVMCQAYSRIQWTPDGVIQRDQIGPAFLFLGGFASERVAEEGHNLSATG